MLKKQAKSITLTATSVATIQEDGKEREIEIENYSCVINSDAPENMNISKYYASVEGKAAYKGNRVACRADYAEFEEAAYALQDEMIEAKGE